MQLDPWRNFDAGVALAGRKNEACEIAEHVTLHLGGQVTRPSGRLRMPATLLRR